MLHYKACSFQYSMIAQKHHFFYTKKEMKFKRNYLSPRLLWLTSRATSIRKQQFSTWKVIVIKRTVLSKVPQQSTQIFKPSFSVAEKTDVNLVFHGCYHNYLANLLHTLYVNEAERRYPMNLKAFPSSRFLVSKCTCL